MNDISDDALLGLLLLHVGINSNIDSEDRCTTQSSNDNSANNTSNDSSATSQDAKVDLKPLIVSVIPIYRLSDTINLFCVLVFILINKLITFSAS